MRKAVAAAVAIPVVMFCLAARGLRADNRGGASARAFMEVYRVLQHPRCMNCHPAGDSPLHGDDSHPHTFHVTRGVDGKGAPSARCVKCHQSANQPGEHKPPGAPFPPEAKQPVGAARWQLPPAKMPLTFQGRTPGQLCRQLLNPKSNGGLTAAALLEVRAWLEGGHSCPAE